MTPSFDLAFREVIEIEGGYSDHPYDEGGKTMYGITEAVARRYNYTGRMQDLPREVARSIFYHDYWQRLDLDHVRNHKVAAYIFDMAVNHGPQGATGGATRIVQRAVNQAWRYWPARHIAVDGWWGPQTLGAVQYLGARYPSTLVAALKSERVKVYERICDMRPSQRDFWRGWLKRCA